MVELRCNEGPVQQWGALSLSYPISESILPSVKHICRDHSLLMINWPMPKASFCNHTIQLDPPSYSNWIPSIDAREEPTRHFLLDPFPSISIPLRHVLLDDGNSPIGKIKREEGRNEPTSQQSAGCESIPGTPKCVASIIDVPSEAKEPARVWPAFVFRVVL